MLLAILKPDLKKCVTVRNCNVHKLELECPQQSITGEIIEEEEKKVKLWVSLTADEKYSEPEPDQQEDDSQHIERNNKLLRLIEKKKKQATGK